MFVVELDQTAVRELGGQIEEESRLLLERAVCLANAPDEALLRAFHADLTRHLEALDTYRAALESLRVRTR